MYNSCVTLSTRISFRCVAKTVPLKKIGGETWKDAAPPKNFSQHLDPNSLTATQKWQHGTEARIQWIIDSRLTIYLISPRRIRHQAESAVCLTVCLPVWCTYSTYVFYTNDCIRRACTWETAQPQRTDVSRINLAATAASPVTYLVCLTKTRRGTLLPETSTFPER